MKCTTRQDRWQTGFCCAPNTNKQAVCDNGRHIIMPDCHNYSLPMSSPGITKVHPVLLFPVVAFQKVCTKTEISKSAVCDVTKGRDNSATLLQQHFLPLMTVKKVNRPSQLHSQQEAINRGLKMHLSGDLRSHFFFFLTFLSCWKRRNYNQYNLELGIPFSKLKNMLFNLGKIYIIRE